MLKVEVRKGYYYYRGTRLVVIKKIINKVKAMTIKGLL